MNFKIFIFILFISFELSLCQLVSYTDCGSKNLNFVKITPCDQPVCQFYLNTFAEVEASFVSPMNTDEIKENIVGIVRGKELPFPRDKTDPCKSGFLTPSCPLKKGETYVFKTKIEVKPFYPAIPIELKYSLVDKNNDPVICVVVKAILLSNNPKKSRRKDKHQ